MIEKECSRNRNDQAENRSRDTIMKSLYWEFKRKNEEMQDNKNTRRMYDNRMWEELERKRKIRMNPQCVQKKCVIH